MSETPSPNAPLAEHLMREKQLAAIDRAILKLSPECQRVFLLSRLHGMSCKQIAVLYGMPVKEVERNLAKALALVKCGVPD